MYPVEGVFRGSDQLLLPVPHDVLEEHPPLEHDLLQLDAGPRIRRRIRVRIVLEPSSDPAVMVAAPVDLRPARSKTRR